MVDGATDASLYYIDPHHLFTDHFLLASTATAASTTGADASTTTTGPESTTTAAEADTTGTGTAEAEADGTVRPASGTSTLAVSQATRKVAISVAIVTSFIVILLPPKN